MSTSNKSETAQNEEKVLKFWQDNKIFEKSLEKEAPNGDFVFYDGPPFATGLPHYGHILAGTMKDIIPRYQTMMGKKVRRRWGWDCHGLPIENLIEKELNLKTKQDIYKYGVEKFNEAAHNSVLRYDVDWKKIVPRTGRWVDMDKSYLTMQTSYSESIWHIFKTIYDKNLIYEGHKAMHLCPRCETTLSNFEVNQGYKDIKDLTATVKFKIDAGQKIGDFETDDNTYILAWTTTPWTLPGNVALAVNPSEQYIQVKLYDKKSETINLDENQKIIFLSKENIEKKILGNELCYMNLLEIQHPDDDGHLYELFTDKNGNKFGFVYLDGSELVGKSYKPLFDYYLPAVASAKEGSKDESLENRENACPPSSSLSGEVGRGWKIYGADFVTTEEGTGVVHIAPAFGSDDMELGQKENLPFIQHVSIDGKFKPEVGDGLAGLSVKPKDDKESGVDHMSTDIEMIKLLAAKGALFSKEKVEHSYPHCWRCDTPLLNYATSSWFLKVTGIKEEMLKANNTVNWVPENMQEGRFGKWLEGARDWAISRTRFWGAPLPVWKCQTGNFQFSNSNFQTRDDADKTNQQVVSKTDGCGAVKVIGSIKELKENLPKRNNIFVMRHGEADNNVKNVISTQSLNNHHLTEKGREQVVNAVTSLKEKNINLIISSPFVRTTETAELVAEGLGIKKEEIIFDDRIGEINLGNLEGKTPEDYHNLFGSLVDKFTQNPMNGETLTDVRRRVSKFVYEINKQYSDKNILIITHEYPAWMLITMTDGLADTQSVAKKEAENLVQNAQVVDLDFRALPHNKNYEVDLHMPFVDEAKFACACGGEMTRIPEVFDCWFESGAMPYGSNHYPFENLDKFNPEKNIGFPADFIAEGQDQTRGWFYTSLVLSTALFGKAPYKNVIVNGMVMAEDGKKMSKSLKNYPDPLDVLNKYGADALRYYLISSPIVRAEDLNFSEKGVDEVLKKIILKMKNVLSFYELYADKNLQELPVSDNVLDKWILARLSQLNIEITKGLDNYELDRASRPIMDFVDDLSTWYIRRSRDRFKGEDEGDKNFALATTVFVLKDFSKLIAPFMPFLAEEIYQKIENVNFKIENDNEKFRDKSVHLQDWPKAESVDEKVLEEMQKVRDIVSLALEARAKTGIKVRQPLQKLTAYSQQLTAIDEELVGVIKDEVNVKEVVFEKGENRVELDTEITPELKAEGQYRELLRNVQRMRKDAGLVPSDVVDLFVETDGVGKELIEKFENDLKKTAGVGQIKFETNDGEIVKIDDLEFKLKLIPNLINALT